LITFQVGIILLEICDITIIQDYSECLAQLLFEFAELSKVRRQDGDVFTSIRSLPDQMSHKRSNHVDFVIVGMGSSKKLISACACFEGSMVKPKKTLPHSMNLGVLLYCLVILKCWVKRRLDKRCNGRMHSTLGLKNTQRDLRDCVMVERWDNKSFKERHVQ